MIRVILWSTNDPPSHKKTRKGRKRNFRYFDFQQYLFVAGLPSVISCHITQEVLSYRDTTWAYLSMNEYINRLGGLKNTIRHWPTRNGRIATIPGNQLRRYMWWPSLPVELKWIPISDSTNTHTYVYIYIHMGHMGGSHLSQSFDVTFPHGTLPLLVFISSFKPWPYQGTSLRDPKYGWRPAANRAVCGSVAANKWTEQLLNLRDSFNGFSPASWSCWGCANH